MVRCPSRIVFLSSLLTLAGCGDLPASPVSPASAASSPGPAAAPVITRPVCGAVSKWPDQPMTLAWSPVSGAQSYDVELDCMNCGHRPDPWVSQSGTPWITIGGLSHTEHTIDVTATVRREGGTALRWRVWANDREGHAGAKTDWCVTPFSDSGLPVPGARLANVRRIHRRICRATGM